MTVTMQPRMNHLGQPVGFPLSQWVPPQAPKRQVLTGRTVRLEPIDPVRHAGALYAANAADRDGRMWTYLPYGPFDDEACYRAWMERTCLGEDPLFFAIVDAITQLPLGLAAYLRIEPRHGVVEVGHLAYSPALQRTQAATEAMYVMMQHAFHLGYRRYEWKCDSLNAPSRAAAQRLGFSFEGIFRQAVVTRGRNRDTAWYSIIDRDWPDVQTAFERWLASDNFDAHGRQRLSLSVLTGAALKSQNGSSEP
jgi:RimJ/RimL family protein N-acetyltransferase